MKKNVLSLFVILFGIVSLYVVRSNLDIKAAGAGPLLFSSSNQTGTTTNLRGEFSNGRCRDLTKTFDEVGISAFNLEVPSPSSINFSNAELELKLYGEVGTTPELIRGTVIERIVTDSGAVLRWLPDGGAHELRSDSYYEVYINGVNVTSSNLVGFGIDFYYQGETLNSGYPICFGSGYGDYPGSCTEHDAWCFIKRFNESGIIPTATPRPIPTLTPTATGIPTPTSTPANTPTPTPTPVSLEELGFANQSSVEVWVSPGQSAYAFDLVSTFATQFTFYGYPTNYGPGINTSPASGSTVPGRSTKVSIQVASNVPFGTYAGLQRLFTTNTQIYGLIPVTVHVGQYFPTATPTFTPTATPTSAPTYTPTPTVQPTPVPLSIYSVGASALSPRSALISWQTSVPATSSVQYGLKANQLNMYSPEIPEMVVSHSVDISDLQPNKKYYYKVHSRSWSGEWVVSNVFSFNTPRK